MKKKEITFVTIIDASGSMSSKTTAVKDGLMETFNDIKRKAKRDKHVKFNIIVIDFSNYDDIRVLIESSEPKKLTKKLINSYKVRGLTALYDAIAFGLNRVGHDQDGVFVNILTDGYENDSKEYTSADLKKLIKRCRKNGWAITFQGTTEDAVQSAIAVGISRGNTSTYADSRFGTTEASLKRSKMLARYYASTVDGDESINIDTLSDDVEDENATDGDTSGTTDKSDTSN